MVKFNKDNFTITVKTGTNPIEDWLLTHNELVSILQTQDPNNVCMYYYVLDLLYHMMPDLEAAKKMIE